MGFKFTSRINEWSKQSETKLDASMLSMITDVHRIAVMNAPHLTGALRNSGKIDRKAKMHYSVTFGDSRVPYAKIRHEVNRKNPSTIQYLSKSAEYVAKDISKYFKGVFK